MRILLILIALLSPSLGARSAAAPLKVLVVTGGHGFQREPFFKMFGSNSQITFQEARHKPDNAAAFDRPDLLEHDVVVLYDMMKRISDSQKERFLSLFEKGVGLVVLHHALVSYQKWPDYERIIGGTYPEPEDQAGKVSEALGYEHDVKIPVTITGKHPVTEGLTNFVIHDEIYWGFRTTKDVTPLLSTTHPKSGKPLAWARAEKKSRVVFIQLGHGPEAFNDPSYQKLLAQAIAWTARK